VLLAHALATTRIQLVIDSQRALVPDELARFRELVKRRRAREPVAYLVGAREFYGRTFRVDRRVLVPRPDTEKLVEVALEKTKARSMSLRALDLCTGSGCVAITIARERPTSRVHATDASDEALEVARDNALRLGATNASLARGDLYDAVDPRCRFEVVVSNPPYVATEEIASLMPDVREFEPPLALDGGQDGLAVLRRIVARAPEHLSQGGTLALEVGAGQAGEVTRLLTERGFSEVGTAQDYARIDRVVFGTWGEAAVGRSLC
jgi:release factor glutamine methyltransferase